jgi:hypothetical protein
MNNEFGYFEDGPDIPNEKLQEMIEEETTYKEEELRLTHVALRYQLLEKARMFVEQGVHWRMKPLKQRLAELTVTYRMMTKLTEDE